LRAYRVRFTPEAARLIARLPPEIKKVVRSASDDLRKYPHAGSELSGEFGEYRSLKPGRYRIIYRIDENAPRLEIYQVSHRRDVYETLRKLLKSLAKGEG
jgi:mRNA-degrading endonuclease RelE of RelBE toxin-antitoxin system